MSLATPERIRTLQRKLICKAKAEPAFRFYLLYDKICREDILRHAYALARANAGAPGVDGVTFATIEAAGVEEWLAAISEGPRCEDVPAGTGAAGDDPEARWRRAAARHPDDPGPGGADRRQAGAGTDLRGGLRARGLWLSAQRSGTDAIKEVHGCSAAATPTSWMRICRNTSTRFRIADLMQSVARRIVDRHVLRLIKLWLKAPVEERDGDGKRRMTGGKGSTCGTPQGGVVSPLLANLYMNRFLKHWRATGRGEAFRAHVVAYADDFVILSRGHAAEALAWTRQVMARLGLDLNEAKTSVRDARRSASTSLATRSARTAIVRMATGTSGASPSKKSVQRLKAKVGDLLVPGNMGRGPRYATS